jgi:hypothetical protein
MRDSNENKENVMAHKTIVDFLCTDAIAGKVYGFGRGKAFFFGKVREVEPVGKWCHFTLQSFTNRRASSRMELTSGESKTISIPIRTIVWRMPHLSALAFRFVPWTDQGIYRACICDHVILELAMKYCRQH